MVDAALANLPVDLLPEVPDVFTQKRVCVKTPSEIDLTDCGVIPDLEVDVQSYRPLRRKCWRDLSIHMH